MSLFDAFPNGPTFSISFFSFILVDFRFLFYRLCTLHDLDLVLMGGCFPKQLGRLYTEVDLQFMTKYFHISLLYHVVNPENTKKNPFAQNTSFSYAII